MKDDINCKEMTKESKEAADLLINLTKMHGDGSEPAKQLLTEQTPFQLCDDDISLTKEYNEIMSLVNCDECAPMQCSIRMK